MKKIIYKYEYEEKNIYEIVYELIREIKTRAVSEDYKLTADETLGEIKMLFELFNSTNFRATYLQLNLMNIWQNLRIIYQAIEVPKIELLEGTKKLASFSRAYTQYNENTPLNYHISKNFTENFPLLKDLKSGPKETPDLRIIGPEQRKEYLQKVEDLQFRIIETLNLKENNFVLIYGENNSVRKMEWDGEKFESLDSFYEYDLNIEISSFNNEASSLFRILNNILSGLSLIEGLSTKLIEIKEGSLISKIRVFIKELKSKEAFEDTINTTADIVAKRLSGGTVSHSESKKNTIEIEKMKSEQLLLEKEIEAKPSEFESKMSRALQLEKMALENEALRLKNEKARLDNINAIAELIAKGILDAQKLTLKIDNIKLLSFQKDEIDKSVN